MCEESDGNSTNEEEQGKKTKTQHCSGSRRKTKTKDNLARTDGVAIKKAIFKKQQTKIKDTIDNYNRFMS